MKKKAIEGFLLGSRQLRSAVAVEKANNLQTINIPP